VIAAAAAGVGLGAAALLPMPDAGLRARDIGGVGRSQGPFEMILNVSNDFGLTGDSGLDGEILG
jgi:hypothetical protein